MFSKEDVDLLALALDTQAAVFKRRHTAEANPAIKEIVAGQYAAVLELKSRIHNPALLSKGGK